MNMNYALFAAAMAQYGTKEVRGKRANPKILGWLRRVLPWVNSDEVDWCSVFLLAMAEEVGAERPELDKVAAAASWKKVGSEVQAQHWAVGDVVILQRDPTSWKAHVGLFVNTEGDKIRLLGGNQSNKVTIKSYPLDWVSKVVRLGHSERGMLPPCYASVID